MEYQNQFKVYFKDNFLYDLKAGFLTAVAALPLASSFCHHFQSSAQSYFRKSSCAERNLKRVIGVDEKD